MAVLNGTNGPNVLDAIEYGDSNDTIHGKGGNDTLAGYDGYDKLYGGAGNDKLYGEGSYDDLYGGKGVDQLYGDTAYLGVEGNDGDGADYFYFDTKDSGDIFDGKADTIHDFEEQDQIWLKGEYTYDASGTHAPGDGEFSIWQKGADYVVTWNAENDSGYHDVLVKGDAPTEYDISFYG
jgi:Ca2+-binding RTX toxin-like protein